LPANTVKLDSEKGRKTMTRMLADREFDGINVRLLWDDAAAARPIVLEYEDTRQGIAFVLHPPPERALDAFYHPNAYLPANA
jgi:hypothetical protein